LLYSLVAADESGDTAPQVLLQQRYGFPLRGNDGEHISPFLWKFPGRRIAPASAKAERAVGQ
jgi:hypothetical protein